MHECVLPLLSFVSEYIDDIQDLLPICTEQELDCLQPMSQQLKKILDFFLQLFSHPQLNHRLISKELCLQSY